MLTMFLTYMTSEYCHNINALLIKPPKSQKMKKKNTHNITLNQTQYNSMNSTANH